MEGVLHPVALVLIVHPEDVLVLVKEAFTTSGLITDPVAFILVQFSI